MSGAIPESESTSGDGHMHCTVGEPPTKKAKGLSKILSKRLGGGGSGVGSSLTTHEKIKQELDQYLCHPQLDMENSPLEWWKSEQSRYPRLAKLARRYLCVCATSVASERVFSCAGQIVSDQRSSLKPDKVDNLVFLARNLK